MYFHLSDSSKGETMDTEKLKKLKKNIAVIGKRGKHHSAELGILFSRVEQRLEYEGSQETNELYLQLLGYQIDAAQECVAEMVIHLEEIAKHNADMSKAD